ncbi:MAG: hypothetical protein JW836_08105 [Deltaproteobacteria bacterium]|nr:hypothetical protein [Deltaproteobacteria bacterium]
MKHLIEWQNIRIVPVLHNRMEFALEVRRQFDEFKPAHVAVEYPTTLADLIIRAVKRLPLLSTVHYRESDGTFVYLLVEPTDGQVEAVRLALEQALPVNFIDRDMEGYPLDRSPMPDPYAVTKIGHYVYCQAYLKTLKDRPSSTEDTLRERTMAHHLQKLNASGEKVFFVCGLYHLPGVLRMLELPQTEVIGRRRREGAGLAHLYADSSREVMTEMPLLAAAYERFRSEGAAKEPRLDRLKIQNELIALARRSHWNNSKEELTPSQVRVLHKFARNYALITGALVPNFYQLVVAARGAADDNFAYELWDKGSEYPWQTETSELPVMRLSGEDLFLDQKRIKFHRRLKTFRRRLVPVPVKKKVREKVPGEWKKSFDGFTICSYPPEDVVIEGYGRHLQEKAVRIKTEENARIVPFVSSMMEGIDIRETVRNWAKGEIYVREARPFRGKVGSVVVIFEPDLDKDKESFPWKVTWLGEHEQESDMAFYSTPAGEVMDGPGISSCQYGGFMLTYPPLRVFDIWKDPFFDMARNKPERLLMAAVDYSLEKHVVYVAANPPSGWCHSLAARLGKKIIYLPIGTFSPVTLKKIRRFHVLSGHHVRKYAKQFLST